MHDGVDCGREVQVLRSSSCGSLVVLLLLTAPAQAACPTPTWPDLHPIDGPGSDTTPPSPAKVVDVDFDFDRGEASGCEACPDRAYLELVLTPGTDDTTPADEMGYVILLSEGEAPDGIRLPDQPFRGPEVRFEWEVPADILTEDFAAIFVVRAVDASGNQSADGAAVDLRWEGIPPILAGCDTSSGVSAGLLAAGSVWLVRRRRR